MRCHQPAVLNWGLRDYGTAKWEGGDDGCDHVKPIDKAKAHASTGLNVAKDPERMQTEIHGSHASRYKHTCGKCGARRIDRQLGLEPTPDEYLAGMVDVFRAVWRVLRDDGTCWVNMGDGYAQGGGSMNTAKNIEQSRERAKDYTGDIYGKYVERMARAANTAGHFGLKPKDLIGMPWRLAFALQADGWYLRSDIIWAKPNPMPESVTDRPTKSHEYMFLLTKKPRYYYDADAVREKHKEPGRGHGEAEQNHWSVGDNNRGGEAFIRQYNPAGRNLRDVWTIPTESFADAHFATFPRRLVEPCIKAGTSDKGCCPECGAPWRRVVERKSMATRPVPSTVRQDASGKVCSDPGRHVTESTTVGWEPGCECYEIYATSGLTRGRPEDPTEWLTEPCLVLDPFAGSGTTGVVAKQLGRSFVGCELNPKYAEMARKRIENPEPLPKVEDVAGQMEMFA